MSADAHQGLNGQESRADVPVDAREASWSVAFRSARFLPPNHDGILVPPNLVGCGGKFINPTGPGEDHLTPCHELKISTKPSPESAMTLGDLVSHYQTNNGAHSVLRIGQQVIALAMILKENCRAPEEGADRGEFWCSAGPLRDMDNEALANSHDAFEVWVSPPGTISNYQLRGRFRVSGLIDNQQALDEAGQMRSSEEPVVLIIQIQRVPEP